MSETESKPETEATLDVVEQFVESYDGPTYEALNELRLKIADHSPVKDNPIDTVLWVPVEDVRPNDYNPNEVADREMELLHKSIDNDGYTQPVVCVELPEDDSHDYEIVDGFHRYMTLQMFDDIYDRSDGRVPITVIRDKSKNERRASTVRHNRARGKHSVSGKSEVVFGMLDDGWEDEEICKELGMEKNELARIKHTSGFSKLFDDTDYQQAWKTTRQLEVEKDHGEGETP